MLDIHESTAAEQNNEDMEQSEGQKAKTTFLTFKEAKKKLKKFYKNCNHLVEKGFIDFSRVDLKRGELRAFYAGHQFTPHFLSQRRAKLCFVQNVEGGVFAGLWAGVASSFITFFVTESMGIKITQSFSGIERWGARLVVICCVATLAILLGIGIGICMGNFEKNYRNVYLSPRRQYIEPFELKLIERKMDSQFKFEVDPKV